MSWPDPHAVATTDPAYYHDADRPEALIRADFARYQNLRTIAPYGETPEQRHALVAEAKALRSRAFATGAEARRLWLHSEAMVTVFQQQAEAAVSAYFELSEARAEGISPVSELEWRTMHYAAVVTGRIEPRISGSSQDSARSRHSDRALGRAPEPTSVLDRALGGRGPDLDLDRVTAIIDAVDDLVVAEEHRSADPTIDDRGDARERALRQVHDLTAEHRRTSERFAGIGSHDQDLIQHLDGLLERTRDARTAALEAGATPEEIHTAYLSGRDGDSFGTDAARSGPKPGPGPNEPTSAAGIEEAVAAAIGEPGTDGGLDTGPMPEPDTGSHHDIGATL